MVIMAEIGGPLAHQLPLHNHRGGLVQPSLVMNHHLDMDCHGGSEMHHQSKFKFVSFLIFRIYTIPSIQKKQKMFSFREIIH